MNKREYRQFLQSAAWRAIRTAAYKRANYKCERCGNPGSREAVLNCHHKNYERVGGNELPEDLEVWCRPCHMTHHLLVRSVFVAPPIPKKKVKKKHGQKRRGHRPFGGQPLLPKDDPAYVRVKEMWAARKKSKKHHKQKRQKQKAPPGWTFGSDLSWGLRGSPEYQARQKAINARMQADHNRRNGKLT